MATKFPWKTALVCSVLVGLLALRAVFVFNPKSTAAACLTLWGGPHLGPFAAFAFSNGPSLKNVPLGFLLAAFILLPVWIGRPSVRALGILAVIIWFMCGLGYVYSGV